MFKKGGVPWNKGIKGRIHDGQFKKGNPYRFKKGDNTFCLKGEANNFWKGDDVGYFSLHRWVRKYLPEPDACENCGAKPPRRAGDKSPLDLACITGILSREFCNWKYLCLSCHRKLDDSGFKIGNNYGKVLALTRQRDSSGRFV